tara:strand:+ start:1339 stop:1644 length:306 start_codon:yes stop_codon:yes gene_type:complete
MEIFVNILFVILLLLLLVSLWKAVGILMELNSKMKNVVDTIEDIKLRLEGAVKKIETLQGEASNFTRELSPFFTGGRELIDDILKNKREAEAAQKQVPEAN